MCRFTVIGISDSDRADFDRSLLDGATAFSGGRRHHAIVSPTLPAGAHWIEIAPPLRQVFDTYRRAGGHIVVFASGDPLFYGFASTLKREFPGSEITVVPAFNSLQTLAHRLVMPYHDMRAVSLTGRPWRELDNALIRGGSLIGALTDHTHTPAAIAGRMLEYGYDNYLIHTGENLGNIKLERVTTLTLPEARGREFRAPNCVILERISERHRPMGIPESSFHHLDGRGKMITKAPIRLISLSMLDLAARRQMWDVGFCTGSVSIEARLLFPDVNITAFERRPECERLIDSNARRFGVPGINVVIADFMELNLSDFPAPDAVFIGGHGGRLPEMIRKIAPLMAPGGCVVFNSVSAGSSAMFTQAAQGAGLELHGSHTVTLDNHNPIMIFKAVKCPRTI